MGVYSAEGLLLLLDIYSIVIITMDILSSCNVIRFYKAIEHSIKRLKRPSKQSTRPLKASYVIFSVFCFCAVGIVGIFQLRKKVKTRIDRANILQ